MRGIESVKRWFADFSDCYIIIGGKYYTGIWGAVLAVHYDYGLHA